MPSTCVSQYYRRAVIIDRGNQNSMHLRRILVSSVCLLGSEAMASGWEIVARTVEDTSVCSDVYESPRVAASGAVVIQAGDIWEGNSASWYRQLQSGEIEQQGILLESTSINSTGHAVDGDVCIVGKDEGYSQTALVYDVSGSGDLTATATLAPWGGASNQFFAWPGTISLSGNIAAIGAPYDTPNGYSSGSVWIFERSSSGIWSNLQRLKGASSAAFGQSVWVYGDQMVVVASGNMYAEDSYASVYRRAPSGQWALYTSMSAASICDDRLAGCAISDTALVLVSMSGERFAARWQNDGTLGTFESFGSSAYSSTSSNEHIVLSNDWLSFNRNMYRLPDEGGFVDAGWLAITTSVPDANYSSGTIDSMGPDKIVVGATFQYPMDGSDWQNCQAYAMVVFEWSCDSDVTSDAIVDMADVSGVIDRWGFCPGCDGDVNGDGVIDVLDLLAVLANWGPCG
jgi:hypothetical protein